MGGLRTTAIAATLFTGMCGGALAATEWVFVTGLPDTNFFVKNYMQFIEEVEAESNGELTFKYFGNQTLVKRDAIRRALQENQAQIGEVDFVPLSNEDPVFQLDSIPGVGSTYEDATALLEAQQPHVEKAFADRGLRVIAYAPWGGQGFYTQDPIEALDDFEGLKLRIYSPATLRMGEVLGANPTILPAEEVPQAFATGLIDSMFTGAATGVITQAWDHTNNFLYVGAMHSKQALVVNEEAFQALSPELQNIVLEAGKRATERGWMLSEMDDQAQIETLAEKGMNTSTAWPELEAKMTEIGALNLEEWKKNATPEALEVLDEYEKKVSE
jgi:TRAP-type C4-dicarboxylate transport system substrate-binding protein